MKYVLNKKIFCINLLLCVLLVGTIIYLEGTEVIKTKTEIVTCPEDGLTPCKIRSSTGEIIYMQQGESNIINQFNQERLNIANYGVWILSLISLIINHFICNRKYPIKKEIKKLINKFDP